MSAFLFNNLNKKRYFKSCYQLTKNFKTLTNGSITGKSKLFKKHLMTTHCQFRGTSSKSLTIKQYQSSRKYTITWKLERLMGWSLIVLIPVAFAIESKELEMALGTSALLHTYWGCQSMCSDYLRSYVVGKLLPIIVRLSIVFLSLASLAGVYQLIYEDIGLINMIKKIWSIRGRDYMPPNHSQKVEKK